MLPGSAEGYFRATALPEEGIAVVVGLHAPAMAEEMAGEAAQVLARRQAVLLESAADAGGSTAEGGVGGDEVALSVMKQMPGAAIGGSGVGEAEELGGRAAHGG